MIVTRRLAAGLLYSIARSAGEHVALPGEETPLHGVFEGNTLAQRGTQRRRLGGGADQRLTEDGGYGCSSRSLENPCMNVDGYDLLPLLPTCQQYILCQDQRLAFTFSCAEGKAFDQRLKTCLSEELSDCPCRKISASESIDGPNPLQSWYEIIHSESPDYVWVEDGADRSWPHHDNKDSQSGTPSKSGKATNNKSKGEKYSDDVAKSPKSGKATNNRSKGAKYSDDVAKSPKSGKAANNSSKGANYSSDVAASSTKTKFFGDVAKSLKTKNGKSTNSEHGQNSVFPPLVPIPSPPTELATTEPAATRPGKPNTSLPSAMLSSNSPTALPLATTGPTATKIINPNTSPPSAISPGNSPTIALPVETTEPTATKSIGPQTNYPSAILSSNSTTIALTSTSAPSQQPSRETCISGSRNETFDGGVFPIYPWTTGGDGNWTIHEDIVDQGTFFIKSPDLGGSASIAVANASVSTCETFLGGTMSITVLAGGVLPPTDIFGIYLDGVEKIGLIE